MNLHQASPPPDQSDAKRPTRSPENEINSIFSRIAPVYDCFNRVFSFGLDAIWRKRLAAAVLQKDGGREKGDTLTTPLILDLAAGTLEVSLAIKRKDSGPTILAVDFCRDMLKKGAKKLAAQNVSGVLPVTGDAYSLPLPAASVDGITLAFGLRNMAERGKVFSEALRVLKPGARFCVLEFGSASDRIMFGLYNAYLKFLLPIGGRLLSRDKKAYRHLADSILAFPSAKNLCAEMQLAGFKNVTYTRMTAGIVFLYTASV